MAISGGDGSIILTTQIDQTGLKRGMASMKSGVSGLAKSFAKIGASIGIAFGVKALIDFGKQAVQLASDLQEVQNVVDVAFGNMAYKIESFSKTAIENFGISELTAKRTASTYMAMAKGMGIADEAASDMAITMTGLTADIASFYNMSQERADVILKSVYTGETETLKQLGIVMTEVNLENFAMSRGITKSLNSMTQQEKTMLRYQFVLQQTALAQGDFVRTQDSWANQTRILSERWKEMQTQWGEAFKTIGTLVLPAVNALISGLTKAGQIAAQVAQQIVALFDKEIDTTKDVSENVEETVTNQNELTDAVKETNKATKGLFASFDEINQITSDNGTEGPSDYGMSNIETSIAPVKTKLNNTVAEFGEKIKETFEPVAKYVDETFGVAFKSVGKTASNEWQRIRESAALIGQDFSENIAPRIEKTFTEDILPVAADTIQYISEDYDKMWEISHGAFNRTYSEVVSPFAQRFVNIWGDMWDKTKEVWDEKSGIIHQGIQDALDGIGELWNTFYEVTIKPIADRIGETIDWLWNDHLKGLWDNVVEFGASLMETILTVWNNYLQPLWEWAIKIFGPIISDLITNITDKIGTIIATISDVISGIIKALTGILDFITGVFSGDWEKAWEGIKTFFSGIWDAIWGVIKGVINKIIDGLNSLWKAVYRVFSGIANGIGGAVGFIGDLLGKDWKFSLPQNPPLIPKLAQGAVIPPNREFLAVLGDQKHGTNIEAPLDTIVEAFKIAQSQQGAQSINIKFTGSLAELARVLKPAIERENKRDSVFA